VQPERILCQTPTPGKQPTSIPLWKYEAVRAVILEVVPREEPGIPTTELLDWLRARLDADVQARLGSIAWHATTVKLHMEVLGELRRVPGARPQRLVLG